MELKNYDLKETNLTGLLYYLLSGAEKDIHIKESHYLANGICAVIQDFDGKMYEITITPHKEIQHD